MPATFDALEVALPACEAGLDPDEVDRRLAATARAHERCEASLAFWLLEVDRRALYRGFGYRDTIHLAAGRYRIDFGTAYRLLRAARACEASAPLREAFERGEVPLSKVDVLLPVLGGGRDADWVARARTETRRELKSEVQRALGLEPDSARIPLTVLFAPSQWRVFLAALEKCRRVAGDEIGEAEAIELLCAEFLATPADEHDSPCGGPKGAEAEHARGLEGGGEQPREKTATVPCAGAEAERARDVVEGHERDGEQRGDGAVAAPCAGASGVGLSLHVSAEDPGTAWNADPAPEPPEAEAGSETELRWRVLRRDGYRCVVPGCGARRDLQVDHILPRGRFPELRRDERNLCTTCAGCHALKTDGLLLIRRGASGKLWFEWPRGFSERPGT